MLVTVTLVLIIGEILLVYSVFTLVTNQLDAQNLFYNKFISSLYMFRAHVLIVRRSKLYCNERKPKSWVSY